MLWDVAHPHLGTLELPKTVLCHLPVSWSCQLWGKCYSPGNSLLTASFQWLEEFPSSVSSSASIAPGALLQMFEEIHQSPVPGAKLLVNIFQLAPTASYGSPSSKLLRIKRAQPSLIKLLSFYSHHCVQLQDNALGLLIFSPSIFLFL